MDPNNRHMFYLLPTCTARHFKWPFGKPVRALRRYFVDRTIGRGSAIIESERAVVMDWKSRAPWRTVNDIGFLRILTLHKCLITKNIYYQKPGLRIRLALDPDPSDVQGRNPDSLLSVPQTYKICKQLCSKLYCSAAEPS